MTDAQFCSELLALSYNEFKRKIKDDQEELKAFFPKDARFVEVHRYEPLYLPNGDLIARVGLIDIHFIK